MLTSDTSPTAIISGIIVPKSPKEPASSDRENFSGVEDIGDTVFTKLRSGNYSVRNYTLVRDPRSAATYTKIVYQSLK
jgi:hypothetical protein